MLLKGRKLPLFIFLIFFVATNVCAQHPIELFQKESFDIDTYSDWSLNKTIPESIRASVLTALSYYPELRDSRVVFRLKKRKTPLTSRPRISSIFRKKKNRTYVITISIKSNERLEPILFQNLPYNAQIGVIGHELGHIVEYNSKHSFQILGLSFKILNPKFVNSFEFNTDRVAIEHGLGYQLKDWSVFVRKALKITEWQGASKDVDAGNAINVDQRYMNPETIQKYIDSTSIYNQIKE